MNSKSRLSLIALFLSLFLWFSTAYHFVGLCGSLRTTSCNHGLLRTLQQKLPKEHTLDIIVPSDLPLYNEELEKTAESYPPAVKAFRKRLQAADGIIFASPEYNYSITGALKNAIEWGSRGAEGGNLFNDKPGCVVSAGGADAGLRSQNHLRDICLSINVQMMSNPQLRFKIFEQPSVFDYATGNLVDPDAIARTEKFLLAYIDWTQRLSRSK